MPIGPYPCKHGKMGYESCQPCLESHLIWLETKRGYIPNIDNRIEQTKEELKELLDSQNNRINEDN